MPLARTHLRRCPEPHFYSRLLDVISKSFNRFTTAVTLQCRINKKEELLQMWHAARYNAHFFCSLQKYDTLESYLRGCLCRVSVGLRAPRLFLDLPKCMHHCIEMNAFNESSSHPRYPSTCCVPTAAAFGD